MKDQKLANFDVFLGPHFHKEWEDAGFTPKSLMDLSNNQLEIQALGADILLCGTSVQGTVCFEKEHQLRLFAKSHQLKCLTLVDHWGNAKHRFSWRSDWDSLYGCLVLPDQAECDHYPCPAEQLYGLGNPRWEVHQKQMPANRVKSSDLLMISEPIAQDPCSVQNEFDQYQLYQSLSQEPALLGRKIHLKLHPRESQEQWLERFSNLNFYEEDPCKSKTEFAAYLGISSMLLFELALRGSKVASIQMQKNQEIEKLAWNLPLYKRIPALEEIPQSTAPNYSGLVEKISQLIMEL